MCVKSCENCVHWDKFEAGVRNGQMWSSERYKLYPHCGECQKFPELVARAGGEAYLISANSHLCEYFEPTEEYTEQLKIQEQGLAAFYGVRAGVDFPWSL